MIDFILSDAPPDDQGPDKDRNFRTYVPDWLVNDYYASVGMLIHTFADVEDRLNNLIIEYIEKKVEVKALSAAP